jgi:hypothetical protein
MACPRTTKATPFRQDRPGFCPTGTTDHKPRFGRREPQRCSQDLRPDGNPVPITAGGTIINLISDGRTSIDLTKEFEAGWFEAGW